MNGLASTSKEMGGENLWRVTSRYFLHPLYLFKNYRRDDLLSDFTAGLTVAIVMLPQAIAYALVAELPPQMGIYAAIIGSIVGGLWGSSENLVTGPTNTSSLLVLSILLPMAGIGSSEYLLAAGLLAIFAGIFQITLGFARLGMLVNFVSDSVIVGFTAGAGVLIMINQFKHLFRLQIPIMDNMFLTLTEVIIRIPQTHLISMILGLTVIILIILIMWFKPLLPAPLIAIGIASIAVWIFHLGQSGVVLIGEIPKGLPPLTKFPPINIETLGELSSGILAVGSIGLVQTIAVAKALTVKSGKRFDSNQEFIGQGLANIACGFFSGYPVFGSFVRSEVNKRSGGKTAFSSVFAGLLMLGAVLLFAPYVAFIPKTALAGVLIVIAYGMIDRKEILRIWRGAKGDLLIMAITFITTLLLPLQFAVLFGIMASFAVYILRTSTPRVFPVVPNKSFEHLEYQPERESCPQMAIFDLHGDLYFGATNYIEDKIIGYMNQHPEQRFLILRMNNVNQCDISGIHALEGIVRRYRKRGGNVILNGTQPNIMALMRGTGFYEYLGEQNFIFDEKQAISYAFHYLFDPVICIYECERRVFQECQNLPKHIVHTEIVPLPMAIPMGAVDLISPLNLWRDLHQDDPPFVIDVREPREYKRGHIPNAALIPLFELIANPEQVPKDRKVIFVCRAGRRSARAAYYFAEKGYQNISVLEGGMQAWETADLLVAVETVMGLEVTNG